MSRISNVSRLPLALLALTAVVALAGCSQPDAASSTDDAEPATAAEPAAAAEPSGAAADDAANVETDATAAEPATAPAKSELLVDLPTGICNTPDGMCLLPDGNVILSVPNFNDQEQPSLLLKITPQNKPEVFYKLPRNPDTGEPFGPLGICVAPSGDLYIADYQMKPPNKSRVMRIAMQAGKPAELVTVVSGFNVSNAVIVRDGFLYVSETQIDTTVKPAISGVFRFKLGEEGVELKIPGSEDPHLLATIECHDEELPLGADGLAFDGEGNLYIGNFADGTVHKFEFDDQGKVVKNEIFARSDAMKSADGLFFDPRTNKIYVADSRANAIQAVSLDGTVETLAGNGDTDGSDGGMDQPCEVLLRGDELIVSNMDWPVPGCVNQQYDKACTLSVIKLD